MNKGTSGGIFLKGVASNKTQQNAHAQSSFKQLQATSVLEADSGQIGTRLIKYLDLNGKKLVNPDFSTCTTTAFNMKKIKIQK